MPEAKTWHFRVFFFFLFTIDSKKHHMNSGAKKISGLQPQGPPDEGPKNKVERHIHIPNLVLLARNTSFLTNFSASLLCLSSKSLWSCQGHPFKATFPRDKDRKHSIYHSIQRPDKHFRKTLPKSRTGWKLGESKQKLQITLDPTFILFL